MNQLTINKSNLTPSIFMGGSSKREIGTTGLSCKLVVQIGRVDGKRVYFLETRGSDGYLVESKTFSSMKKLAAEAA